MPVERVNGGTTLIDVLDRILDKGLVIDAWVRISVVGLEVITIEARVVVASVDTYLRYAQAIGLTPLVSRPPIEPSQGALDQVQRGRNGQSRPLEGVQQSLQGVAGQLGSGNGQQNGGLLEGVTNALGAGQSGGAQGQGDLQGQLQSVLEQLQGNGGNGGNGALAEQLRTIIQQLEQGQGAQR